MVLLLIFSTMKLCSSRSEMISGLSAGLSSLLNEVSGYTIFNNVARGRCLLLARLVSGLACTHSEPSTRDGMRETERERSHTVALRHGVSWCRLFMRSAALL